MNTFAGGSWPPQVVQLPPAQADERVPDPAAAGEEEGAVPRAAVPAGAPRHPAEQPGARRGPAAGGARAAAGPQPGPGLASPACAQLKSLGSGGPCDGGRDGRAA